MDELLKARLEPGEKILWQGTPESFQLLDKTNIGSFFEGHRHLPAGRSCDCG